jgi:hypothetical protein
MIAASRFCRRVSTLVPERSYSPSAALSQLPTRRPSCGMPFTRRIPATSSGLSNPVSAASYAKRRTAASRTLMVEAASFFASSCSRYRSTTVHLKANRSSEQYHSIEFVHGILM